MSSEFYRRTKDLFEEFQNRELHYLKLDKISDFQHTNNQSLPVEEYLQKLNQKEKETEETYRDLMSHMEALDRRTDLISEKLEKLHFLRTTITSKPLSWPMTNHNFDKPTFTSSYSTLTNALPTNFDFKYVPSNTTGIPVATLRDNVQHATTQTDYIFCEKCHFPLAQSNGISNLPISMNESITKLTQPQSQNIVSYNTEHPTISDYTSAEISSSTLKNTTVFSSGENLKPNNIFSEAEVSSSLDKKVEFQKDISNNKVATNIHPEENINYVAAQKSIDLHMLADKNDSINEDCLPTKNDLPICDNLEKTFSKSDDESLNHEFDFLESDKTSKTLKNNAEQLSELSTANVQTNRAVESKTHFVTDEINTHTQEETVNDTIGIQKSNLELSASKKDNFESISINVNDAKDNKSESSVSIGGARSPSLLSEKVSAVSDSDSFSEKEEPQLTATAAYQALLGNISVSKNIKTSAPYSETESEDEVERALATATRKSSNVPVSTTVVTEEKTNEEKKSVQETKPKPEPRKSISISNKPQQLSKKTRKVLGLDTSSASEEDIQSKIATTKKIDEDSDEFDFYD